MKVGLLLNVSARNWLPLTQAAEESGFDSVWIGEHVILPEQIAGHPSDPDHADPPITSAVPVFDPWVQLTYLAAHTKTIRLGTNVYNIGLRHPFVTARALTTLDLVSNGRVEFGIGVSWLKAEWDALQLPFETRGRRADESIEIIKRLFTEDLISHEGEFFKFGPVRFLPKPVQGPWPPLIVGGGSKAALRRAALAGDGWIPMSDTLESLSEKIGQIKAMRAEAGITRPFTVSAIVGAGETPTLDSLRRYKDIGVDRALVMPWTHVREAEDSIRRFSEVVNQLA